MATPRTEVYSTEGVLLLRRDGHTMAVHLTRVEATLEAIVSDHPNGGSVLDRYDVTVISQADRLYLWEGSDPFAEPERMIRNHVEGIEA